jgi:hypothetical protein
VSGKKGIEKIVITLGEVLARQALRRAERRIPTISWVGLLRPVIDRINSRSMAAQTRFGRCEALPQAAFMSLEATQHEFDSKEQVISVPERLRESLRDVAETEVDSGRAQDGNRLYAGVDSDERGMAVPAQIRDRLRDIAGTAADAARLHHSPRSDAIAREHRADAVTIGHEIFFRAGALRPQDPAGFALLTHEATHVGGAMRSGASWRRATEAGVQEEEALALRRERAVLSAAGPAERSRGLSGPVANAPAGVTPVMPALDVPQLAAPISTAPSVGPLRLLSFARLHSARRPRAGALLPAASDGPLSRPMKADVDRAIADSGGHSEATEPSLDEMRRTLFRDLLAQIRVEFERGA